MSRLGKRIRLTLANSVIDERNLISQDMANKDCLHSFFFFFLERLGAVADDRHCRVAATIWRLN